MDAEQKEQLTTLIFELSDEQLAAFTVWLKALNERCDDHEI